MHKPFAARAARAAGFINQMRMVAMKLHTKEQAPKEGGQEAPPKPQVVSAAQARAQVPVPRPLQDRRAATQQVQRGGT